MQNLTPRDKYILRQACEITGTTIPATCSELATALLNGAKILEEQGDPPQSNIDDMRALLRERFLSECLSELSARELRQQIKLVDE